MVPARVRAARAVRLASRGGPAAVTVQGAELELIQDLGDLLEDLAAEPGGSVPLIVYAERMGALRARVREALTAARRPGFLEDFPAQVYAAAADPESDPRANYRYEVFDDGRLVDRYKSLARALSLARGRAKGNVPDRELGTWGIAVEDHRGPVPLALRYESDPVEDRGR